MQKKIIALAIASVFVAPVAMAESSFYGSMDGGVRMQSYDDGDASTSDTTTFSMKMGQYNTSRWGFKGVDDLGDGLKANVQLETSFVPAGVGSNADMNNTSYFSFAGGAGTAPSSGAANNPFGLIFDRQATVGLESSTMGRFDMGWNYTTSYNVISTYDPMGYKFNQTALAMGAADATRQGNVVYQIKMGDIKLQAEYVINNAFGGPVSTSTGANRSASSGTGRAVGVTYAADGLNVGAAYSAADANMGAIDKHTHVTVGAGYSFGDAKVSAGYAKKATTTTADDSTITNMWFGGSFNVSNKATVTAAYYNKAENSGVVGAKDTKTNVLMAMATYSMSKMTTAYVEVDSQKRDTGAGSSVVGAEKAVQGFSMGLDVKF